MNKINCPRCNKNLMEGKSQCPHCGLVLTSLSEVVGDNMQEQERVVPGPQSDSRKILTED